MGQRHRASRASRVLSLLFLRTLRDSLSGWDPETLALLLREELQAYKAVRADTGQERFNVICDLMELSPEETPAGAWARACPHLPGRPRRSAPILEAFPQAPSEPRFCLGCSSKSDKAEPTQPPPRPRALG